MSINTQTIAIAVKFVYGRFIFIKVSIKRGCQANYAPGKGRRAKTFGALVLTAKIYFGSGDGTGLFRKPEGTNNYCSSINVYCGWLPERARTKSRDKT